MKVEDLALDSLIPYARNPRKNDGAVDKVAASIKEFGWRSPIVVDEEMVILAGHTRYKAAKKLGLTEAPVHIAEGLTDAQKKAYRIADNRVAEEAEWDSELLRIELADIESLNFGLELTGLNLDEITALNFGDESDALDDMPSLPDGDKEPFQQKTFTLHDEQAAIVDDAITLARTNPLSDTGLNENSNGNALALICEQWLQQKTS
jgi:ParB family chromosome partitioning protein